jgi:hypothetical protein
MWSEAEGARASGNLRINVRRKDCRENQRAIGEPPRNECGPFFVLRIYLGEGRRSLTYAMVKEAASIKMGRLPPSTCCPDRGLFCHESITVQGTKMFVCTILVQT